MKAALLRYRVVTYIVGTLLIVLTIGTIIKYTGGTDQIVATVGMLHGFLYIVYLLAGLDLGVKLRWSWRTILLVLESGAVPFLSFVVERRVTRAVQGTA